VARRTLANHHRSDRRRRRLDERLQHEVARIVAGAQRPRESTEIARISSAFNRLNPADREVLTLVGWEGLDHGEVARVLGCSRARIRVRLHRARTRLLRTLDTGGADPPLKSEEALSHPRVRTATTTEELSP
jgi:RNA polymerase sigma-70 factor (ECF subfamily)